ncbi:unnamed protein product [Closterium sp. Yama58-4]|nr:unnamed protein product [Closterium sp. Yama58-4]
MLTHPPGTDTQTPDADRQKGGDNTRDTRSSAQGWNVGGSGVPVDDQPDDLIKRLRDPSVRRDFRTLTIFGPHGVGCQITGKDALTIADGKYIADTIVDFHNILLTIRHPKLKDGKTWFTLDTKSFVYATVLDRTWPMGGSPCIFDVDNVAIPIIARRHFSLVVALNLAAMLSGKRADRVTEGVKLVHYDSDGMHARDATIIDGVRKTLFMIHEAQLPTDDPVKAAAKLREVEHIVIPKEGSPQQSNDKDCGVFVCMYMKYLVRSDFATVRMWVSCDGVTAKDFRRGMRADVCSLATGELMMQLLLEEIDVPLQPIPLVGDQGVLMFPKDDDVRLELARMSRERTNLELGGFVLASAVTSIAKALGTGRQIRLGAYQREEDAAYAYAAGAFVIRRKDTFPKVMELTAGEMAALEGCIEDDVRHLVHKRQWYRWREWRKAMDDIGIKPGTPFELEKGGKSSSQARRRGCSMDAAGEPATADGESVEVSPGEGSDATSPEPNQADAREGESSSSRDTVAKNRRKESPSSSVGNGRSARNEKHGKVSDLPETEEQPEAPPEEPEPESSDDNPNEALPRVNAAADDDAEETNEERSNSAPVTREEFDAMRKTQKDTAATLARLEKALLASLANHTATQAGQCSRGVRKGSDRKKGSSRRHARGVRPGRGRGGGGPLAAHAIVHVACSPARVEVSAVEQRMEGTYSLGALMVCEQLRVHLFISVDSKSMTFYPSSAAKTTALCAVFESLPFPFASLALAADKARRCDLNRTLSDWKTAAAGRVRDIVLPKLGLFRDERDEQSPWAAPRARSAARVRERLALTLDGEDVFAISKWSADRHGMPFASGAFAACARSAFKPWMINGTVTLKLYHMAWLEHVVTDAIRFWETRKGRLSNSAGVNSQIVDGLRECALTEVMAADD